VSGFLVGVARLLDTLTLVDYQPAAATGDCFIERLPSTPDAAVALYTSAGDEADTKLPYDQPRFQIVVRGGADPTVSLDRAQAIYDTLHGAGPVTLPNGIDVIDIIAVQSGPVALGTDDNQRHRHSLNFRAEHHTTAR
jgi:hypothetical protein